MQRWVSVAYPDPPKDDGGTVAHGFPVYGSTFMLEDEYPAVRVYADDVCVAVVFNARSVHLCAPTAATPEAES
jgi:hypothetical protein